MTEKSNDREELACNDRGERTSAEKRNKIIPPNQKPQSGFIIVLIPI
jgi:hypothetical protein